MMDRREALFALGVAAFGSAAPPASALVRLLESALPSAQSIESAALLSDATNSGTDERLRKEIAEQTSRSTSEEGVPVFLACVNLVADTHSGKVPAAAPTALSAAIAAEFRRDTAAWERIQPNAPASDVAKLIQALAEQDFAGGGTERKS